MDIYETTWRARAAEHGFVDVDWYLMGYGPEAERFPTLEAAEARLAAIFDASQWPYCGRGVKCADADRSSAA